MKKFAVITGLRMFADVVDGPGWTDIEVNSYSDNNGKSVSPQDNSSPTPGKGVHITSKSALFSLSASPQYSGLQSDRGE